MRPNRGFYTSPLPSDRAGLTIVSIGESDMLPHARLRREKWHSHQLMFSIEGGGSGEVFGHAFAARVHDICLMPKDRSHGYQVAPGFERWRYLWVEFDGACAGSLMSMLGLAERFHVARCGSVAETIEQIFSNLLTRGDSALHEATTLLLHAMSLIERCARRPSEGAAAADTIDDVKKHMVDHLDQPLTLGAIALVARMSPFHLNRVFRQRTGVPPMRYLRQMRANRAKTLLTRRDLKFSEVGRSVGYPVLPHFSRMFKQETGMTPRRFVAELGTPLVKPQKP